jgi:cephalosporin-C deacetylase-like acetyl esterase
MKYVIWSAMMSIILGGCSFVTPRPLPSNDIFAPYVNMTPKVAAVVSENVVDGIQVTKLRFASVEGSFERTTKPCEYYAILARPAAPATGKRPAMLFCHGGAGFAREDAAVGWARLGYVCISPELVGYGDIKQMHSVNRVASQKYTEHIATVTPDRYACTLFDAAVSGLGAFNLLASQPDVDASRIGITGGSCGGYMVTMLSGLLDNRVKAVFNLYGSGFVQYQSVFAEEVDKLTPEQKKVWIDNFDAATRLARARATYLMYVPTNDHFFSNKSIIATYDAYPGPKYICWSPNMSHAILLPGGTNDKAAPLFTEMEPAYFARALNSNKPPLPRLSPVLGSAGIRTLQFTVADCPKETEAWVYFSPAADPMQKHEDRKWEKLVARASGGTFTVDLPPSPESFDWFAGITWTLTAGQVSRPMSLSTVLIRHENGKADTELK